MNKTVRSLSIVVAIVVMAFSLGSCKYFAFLNPAWGLQGSWKMTSQSDNAAHDDFAYYVFNTDAKDYQIKNAAGQVWQSGPILNLTGSNYDYQIEENTLYPQFEGNENYVEYTLDGDNLTLVLYVDRDKTAQIGTFVCARE